MERKRFALHAVFFIAIKTKSQMGSPEISWG